MVVNTTSTMKVMSQETRALLRGLQIIVPKEVMRSNRICDPMPIP